MNEEHQGGVYAKCSRAVKAGLTEKGAVRQTGKREETKPGQYGGWAEKQPVQRPEGPAMRVKTSRAGRESKGVVGGGRCGEKPEKRQRMECAPQMALRLLLPRERKPAFFPQPYLMAVVRGASKGRHEGCNSSTHPSLRGASERLTSARPAASSCGFCNAGCLNGCYFCLCLRFCAGLLCARHWGPLGLAPLWVCSAQPFKCSKCLWGYLLSSRWERRGNLLCVFPCLSSRSSNIREVRWLIQGDQPEPTTG